MKIIKTALYMKKAELLRLEIEEALRKVEEAITFARIKREETADSNEKGSWHFQLLNLVKKKESLQESLQRTINQEQFEY
tara:strand:- start:7404 stop:7643 length:240 start_codon:yes stop_codon:yes gene_type:complete